MKQYTYSFYKENQKWYIDFPAYVEHGGAKADLQMVAGADKMLDKLSNGKKVTLNFSDAPLAGASIKLKKLFGDPWGATYRSNKPRMVKCFTVVTTKIKSKKFYVKWSRRPKN